MSKPFDLEEALAGQPIKHFKTGQKSYIIGEAKSAKYRKNCYVVQVEDLNEAGEDILTVEYITSLEMNYAMWEEPRPRVQLDLPCPLKKWRRNCYTITNDLSVGKTVHTERPFDEDLHFYFATEKDAQEWIDAIRNSSR